MRTFRDHTTSWSEDVESRHWFFTNIEARFVRRYEHWSSEDGCDESMSIEGDYKSILDSIIEEGIYEPLISPVFSKAELISFYENFDKNKLGFDNKSLLDIIKQNVNW